MNEALIDKVKRHLGGFIAEHGFAPREEGEQTSGWACAVYLESDSFVITITRERDRESIEVGVHSDKNSHSYIGSIVAYLEGEKDPRVSDSLETKAQWLKQYADRILDASLLSSKDLHLWKVKASRRMFGQDKKKN